MSLHVSSAPHVHSKDSTQTIMRDVLIAMLPTTVMGVYAFGLNAALLCVLGVAAAVLAEYGYQKITRQRVRIGDLSAAVTGLLVALNLPGNAPWWMPVVGSFIAIVLVKQLFGGIGDNFHEPRPYRPRHNACLLARKDDRVVSAHLLQGRGRRILRNGVGRIRGLHL